MKLYLDLQKAIGNTPNASVDTPTDKQARRETLSSYAKQPAGVTGASPDKPDSGGKWKEGDSASDDADSQRESDASEDREAGVIKAGKSINKSLNEASDLMKSFNSKLSYEIRKSRPRDSEIEFLTNEMGYSYDDIIKGHAIIKGRDRERFNQWLVSRLVKSPDDIYPRR